MVHSTLAHFIFNNWQRKLMAVFSAMVVWWFVNNSITETKIIPNVPIRIVNLPANKTVVGLLPNRLLSKRVTLTLTGTKDVMQELEQGDVEVLLDVSMATSDDWVVNINKKNLVSLNPSVDLLHHVTQVDHSELVLKLSPLESAKIPITISPPTGDSPKDYEFLDIWPQTLMQMVSGAEEEIQALKLEGLEVSFDLSTITKNELDAISAQQSSQELEVAFPVPDSWKKVMINGTLEEINDPEAQNLRVDFLRKEAVPVKSHLPIRVYYPLKYSDTINATTHPLITNNLIDKKYDNFVLKMPLYVREVSSLFLETILENMEISIIAEPKEERESLLWSLEIIDPHYLEDNYVALLLEDMAESATKRQREILLRKRFQQYLQKLSLFAAPDRKLQLQARLGDDNITVTAPAK